MENKNEDNSTKCMTCEINDAENFHTCPYSVEIYNDEEYLCNCCEDCECNCALEI